MRSFGGLGDGLMMMMMMMMMMIFSLSSPAYLGNGLLVGFGSQPYLYSCHGVAQK